MYTIKVENNGELTTTVADMLVKGALNVNPMHVLVPKDYDIGYCGKFDMSKFNASILFVLPDENISDFKTIKMITKDGLYKERFVEYQLPQHTEFTSKAGIVLCKFIFEYIDIDNSISYIRSTAPTEILIRDNSLESMYLSDDYLDAHKPKPNREIDIGGLKSLNGEIYIVDKSGNRIGDAINIERTYIDNTIASNLQVVMI